MTRERVADRLQPKNGATAGASEYGGLKCVAVGIRATPGYETSIAHAGLLYRRGKEVRLFEMRSHKELSDDAAPPGFCWIEPTFPVERMKLVIARARLVYEKHQENAIPYGFGYSRSSFDEKGGLRLGHGEVGLTCSTIVAALLASEGLPLVEPASWPLPDDSDKKVRKKFLRDLEKKDPEHAKVLQKDIGAPRISPEEVVAAAALCPPACAFDGVQDGAAYIRGQLGVA